MYRVSVQLYCQLSRYHFTCSLDRSVEGRSDPDLSAEANTSQDLGIYSFLFCKSGRGHWSWSSKMLMFQIWCSWVYSIDSGSLQVIHLSLDVFEANITEIGLCCQLAYSIQVARSKFCLRFTCKSSVELLNPLGEGDVMKFRTDLSDVNIVSHSLDHSNLLLLYFNTLSCYI